MTLNRIISGVLGPLISILFLSGCGNQFKENDFLSRGPATPEPPYVGNKPINYPSAESINITASAYFKYRVLSFAATNPSGGLGQVSLVNDAKPIAFAEFQVFDSEGERIQQGETNTKGIMNFRIPKTTGTYTLKVYSRAYNNYLKVSILEDIYSNQPYSISKTFKITSTHIASGSLDISSRQDALIAEADETMYKKIEGGAFNIMYNVLLANEYIRRNIKKNNPDNPGVAPTGTFDPSKWWVAHKASIYWKAGFNPYSYFNRPDDGVSFYTPTDKRLYILGGMNGDVKNSDTDHFDDSIILHEYAHFLEDMYSRSESPGGSHNGDFVVDPRLAWSEGWANYFQSAVLTGAELFYNSDDQNSSDNEDSLPATEKNSFYVDTVGYGISGHLGIIFNLIEPGQNAKKDKVGGDLPGGGTFREVSVARSLYKSSRSPSSQYSAQISGGGFGGGVSFEKYWMILTEKNSSTNAPYSFMATETSGSTKLLYPIPNMGLFNWLLSKNGEDPAPSSNWGKILSEEKQKASTEDYGSLLENNSSGTTCDYTFTTSKAETNMPRSNLLRSDQHVNNDFFLFWYDGSGGNLTLTYQRNSGAPLDLDLILYYRSYVYFEDHQWYSGLSNSYVARQSRGVNDHGTETVSLGGLPAGYYVVNVKVNAFGKTTNSELVGSATYQLYRGNINLCGTERP